MNIYYYFAVKNDNSKVSGIKFAENKIDLANNLYTLREHLLFCIMIPKMFIKLKICDVVLILEHIMYQLNSGYNLVQAINSLLNFKNSIKVQYFLTIIYQKLNTGESVVSAFKNIFNKKELLFLNVMEKYGAIKKSIKYLIMYIEFNNDLKKLLKNKLSYPVFLCIFALIVFFIFLYYLFPRINCIYESKTNTTIYFYIVVISAGILFLYYILLFKFFKKYLFSDILLKNLIKNFHTLVFTTILSILLSSGIFFVKAVEIIKNIYVNSFFKTCINDIANNLEKGISVYDAFYKYKKYFRSDFIEIIRIAEINNKMQEMISKYSEKLYYEVKEKINLITNKLIVYFTIMAGIILIITLSNIMDPIYKFAQDAENII